MNGIALEIQRLAIPSLIQGSATLSIECSEKIGSVALLGTSNITLVSLPQGLSTAVSLAPAIDLLLKDCGLDAAQLEKICVTQGPGSFTGLRIGIGLARALSFGTGVPVRGVSSLATLACAYVLPNIEAVRPELPFVTVLNAFRNELFVAAWTCSNAGCARVNQDSVIARSELATWAGSTLGTDQFLIVSPEKTAFFGELPSIQVSPTAHGVLCADSIEPTPAMATLDLVLPTYLRRSAAEEKKDEIPNIAPRS